MFFEPNKQSFAVKPPRHPAYWPAKDLSRSFTGLELFTERTRPVAAAPRPRIFMGMGFGLVSGRQLGQPWWRNRILVNFASAGKCHPEVTHTKQVPSRSNPNEATAGPPTEPEPGRSKDWRGEAAASRLAYSGPRVALARCRGATSPAGGWPPRPGCSVQPRPSPQAALRAGTSAASSRRDRPDRVRACAFREWKPAQLRLKWASNASVRRNAEAGRSHHASASASPRYASERDTASCGTVSRQPWLVARDGEGGVDSAAE